MQKRKKRESAEQEEESQKETFQYSSNEWLQWSYMRVMKPTLAWSWLLRFKGPQCLMQGFC